MLTDIRLEAQRTGPAMSTAGPFTWRSTSTDGFRKTRVTHRRPRPSHWSGRERIDGIRWEWEGQHGFIVLTRVRQTRTGLRPDGHHRDRPSVADADEHPCQTPHRSVSPASPLRGGQAARLPAPEQIRAAAQEEHREEQRRDLRECRRRHRHHCRGACRRTVQVTNPGTGLAPRARTSNVYSVPIFNLVDHHPLMAISSSLSTRRRRSRRRYTGAHTSSPGHLIPDEPAGVWPGVMGHEARRGGGRRTVQVIR